LDNNLQKNIKDFIIKYDTSINTLSILGWCVLLCRYNDINNIIFGTIATDYNEDKTAKNLGIIKPFGIDIDPNMQICKLLGEIKNTYIKNQMHQFFSLKEIKKSSELDTENSIFDFCVVVGENYSEENINNISLELCSHANSHLVVNLSNSMDLSFVYNEDAFNYDTIERLSVHFKNIISYCMINPEKTVKEIDYISDEEKDLLLNVFNDTFVKYPNDKLIHELFEQQVKINPNKIAIKFNGECLTYFELNERSNKIARHLRKRGIRSESVVGIMVERSLEMIIGVLAIVKAGGAYLPIDPNYPIDRIKYMIGDSSAPILITQSHLLDKCDIGVDILLIDDNKLYDEDGTNLEVLGNINSLLYIIYTSGSTGKPKGVMVEHSQMNNLIHWMQGEFCLLPDEISVHRTNLTFDPSTWEIFWPLSVGASIRLLSKEQAMDAGYLLSLMEDNEKIKMIFLPSSLVKAMAYILTEGTDKKHIKLPLFHIGAEPIGMNTLKKIYSYLDGKIIDTYGPTECTVFNTYYYIEKDDARTIVPIGKPIANNKIYILSKNMQLMPINRPGEICIAGDNVSRGYINNDEKTNEKFINNPFGEGKLYRTGDLGRWLEDGNIEILGRTDYQVKIRGFRIELGEVEEAICRHPQVKDCVVSTMERGTNKYLCAYVVSDQGLQIKDLKNFLSQELPSYMIPTYFMQLDNMPLTINGKVDRKALPEIKETSNENLEVSPSNSEMDTLEGKIKDVWQKILSIKNIDLDDDFFEIGGNSLIVIKAEVELNKLGINVNFKDILEYKTIRRLSEFLRKNI
jgi:amino acid adenylation domain-containing protein